MTHSWLRTYFDYNDSYPTCSRTRATLCIYLPDDYNPIELSQRLGVSPSRTQVKGETRNGKVRNWPTAWFLESAKQIDSKDVRRHIDWLLDQFNGRSETLRQLRDEDATICLSCFWESATGHGGPMLDADILNRIAALNIGIAFDIYFDDHLESNNTDEPRED